MELQNILNKIDSNKQQIDAVGKFDDALLKKIQYKFRLDWNYYSNKMEGGTLTRSETRSVMIGNVTVGGKPIKDVLEMKGHDTVISDILKISSGELKISEKRIKEIHKAIMHEEDPSLAKYIGEWKKKPNEIINYKGEKISFTAPEDVKDKMHALLDKTNAELDKVFKANDKKKHPLILAADFHLDYVTIHPFYDGNGRTTRILTNLILISCGYPPLIIKEQDKTIYYQYLADIQVYNGNRELFYAFMGSKLLESQQLVIDAIEGKGIDESDDVKKEIELLRKELAHKEFTKSPKNVYDAFLDVKKDVWQQVQETLRNFDEFFKESSTLHFVNAVEEKFETYKSLYSAVMEPQEYSKKPAEPKIFGHGIYENNIDHIQWRQTKSGLKGATQKNSAEISLFLNFSKADYKLSLALNDNLIFSKAYTYSSHPDLDDTENMKTLLGKALVRTIKENTR